MTDQEAHRDPSSFEVDHHRNDQPDQPESQGMDASIAPRQTEDSGRRYPLSDEES